MQVGEDVAIGEDVALGSTEAPLPDADTAIVWVRSDEDVLVVDPGVDDEITDWADQTEEANDVDTISGTWTLVADVLDGKPAVRCGSGTTNAIGRAALTGGARGAASTVALVLRIANLGSGIRVYANTDPSGTSGSQSLRTSNAGSDYQLFAGSGVDAGDPDTSVHAVVYSFDGAGNGDLWVDGVKVLSAGSTGSNNEDGWSLGRDSNGATDATDYFEHIVWSGQKTDAGVLGIFAYLKNRYPSLPYHKPIVPAAPTITSPSDSDVFGVVVGDGETVTLTATTPDTDLERIEWWFAGSKIAEVTSAPYSTTWNAQHTQNALGNQTADLVARAVRNGVFADSAPVSITLYPVKTLQIDTFITPGDDTWTPATPAYWLPTGEGLGLGNVEGWGAGKGGITDTRSGGGGAYARHASTIASGSDVHVGQGRPAEEGAGVDHSEFGSGPDMRAAGATNVSGGLASNCIGSGSKFDGGDGTIGSGTQSGGGAAGSQAAGTDDPGGGGTVAGGAPDGMYSTADSVDKGIGAGGGSTAATAYGGGRGEVRVTYLKRAELGFPRIVDEPTRGRDESDATSRNITLPLGSDGLLVCTVVSDGAPSISMSGWSSLGAEFHSGFGVQVHTFYRVATGSDPVAVATSSSEQVSWVCHRVHGASPGTNPGTPTKTATNGTGTNADPPSHTPAGGSAKYLWLANVGFDNKVALSGAPTPRSSLLTNYPAGTGGVQLVSMHRELEASSWNPGSLTTTSGDWVAETLAIPPS